MKRDATELTNTIYRKILANQENLVRELENPVFDALGRRKRPSQVGSLAIERFITKILLDEKNKCWNWTGSKTPLGYGQFRPNTKRGVPRTGAHRFIYQFIFGAIPEEKEVDHKCRNRACCNPAHLRAVTHAENQKRIRKEFCVNGHERNEQNIHTSPTGRRTCRPCIAESVKKHLAKKRLDPIWLEKERARGKANSQKRRMNKLLEN